MKDKATFEISGNFECKKDAPFDTRWRVDAYADLIKEETWRNKDGNIYAYSGMCTVCKDKPGKIYQLTDVAYLTDYNYWKEIGEQTLIEIINNLTSGDTNKALSAAMGKKLNDEKLDKSTLTTDIVNSQNKVAAASSVYNVNVNKIDKSSIVNSLDNTDANKVLSAAQGKFLNDRINSLGYVYKYKGSKNAIEEVLALTDAKIGDVWNVIQEFSAGGKKYPAGTNIACIKNTSTSDHSEANWDTLGGTVDLSGYATKNEMNDNLNNKIDKNDIVDDTSTNDATKPLSARQGKILSDEITNVEDSVQDLNTKIPNKTSQLTNDSNYVTANNVLTKTNTTEYNPTENYHPATKKYIDDNTVKYYMINNDRFLGYLRNPAYFKDSEAETAITYIFNTVDKFKEFVNYALDNKYTLVLLNATNNEKININNYHVYRSSNGNYELSFIFIYSENNGSDDFDLVTTRVFISWNASNGYKFIVQNLVQSDNLTTVTKKTKSEYDSLSLKDIYTMYAVTE